MPVAKAWADRGDQLFALTRHRNNTSKFSDLGITPLIGDVTRPNSFPTSFPVCDTVLVAIGMDRTRYSDVREVYVEGMRNILAKLPDETGHLIYISSTGVYGDFQDSWVDETSPTQPTREGGKACLEAEGLIARSPFAGRATILRLA